MEASTKTQQQLKSRRQSLALFLLTASAGFVATFCLSSSESGVTGTANSFPYRHQVARSAAAHEASGLPYGNLTCPLELNFGEHMGVPVDPVKAKASFEYFLQSGAAETLYDVVRSGAFDRRRAVLVGDSLMRYQFVSMGCLAASASSALDGRGPPEALTLHAPERAFSRGRMRLPGGGEIYFHPFAGKLNQYEGWKGKQESEAPPSAQSWVQACRASEPFLLEGIPDLEPRRAGWPSGPSLSPPDILASLRRDHTTPAEEYGETVALTANDVVFVNAAHHAGSEDSNHQNIDSLLKCMANKRRQGTAHPDWPSIQYVYSSLYHPVEKDANGEDSHCGLKADLRPHLNFRGKDDRYWAELVSHWAEYGQPGNDMIGKDIEVEDRYDLKMGKWTKMRHGKPLVDCIHWVFPGVPDVWVARMAERMRSTMPGAENANKAAAPVASNIAM